MSMLFSYDALMFIVCIGACGASQRLGLIHVLTWACDVRVRREKLVSAPHVHDLARFGNHGSSRPGPTACAPCMWNATQKHMAASQRGANLWPCSDPKHACHAFRALHGERTPSEDLFVESCNSQVNVQLGPKRYQSFGPTRGNIGVLPLLG